MQELPLGALGQSQGGRCFALGLHGTDEGGWVVHHLGALDLVRAGKTQITG